MLQDTLQECVTRLEKLVEEIMHARSPSNGPGRDEWLETVGMFEKDPVMKEILDEARRLRDDDPQTG